MSGAPIPKRPVPHPLLLSWLCCTVIVALFSAPRHAAAGLVEMGAQTRIFDDIVLDVHDDILLQLDRLTAVHRQDHTGDKGGLGCAKEGDRGADILRRAQAADRIVQFK